ncbi:Cell wall protein [Hanseniaspora osmophila]|uniref:glucan endo-1,3-beta-D-glucosidase n=1 Tax=Hanseniaspora osmophila TaxID=56408 RepID=A0A1E5RI28_9ASCO|nr:Cell wall protein [Hanseniaspora osmophila]
MLNPIALLLSASTLLVAANAQGVVTSGSYNSDTSVDMLWFENVGFNGYYNIVSKVSGGDTCDCEILTDTNYYFTGPNAPLDEPVSVHFRGPMILHKFAYYTIDSFSFDDVPDISSTSSSSSSNSMSTMSSNNGKDSNNRSQQKKRDDSSSSSSWTRQAYYEDSTQSASNVTFLTKQGSDSKCLGKALSFADTTGVGKASEAAIPANNTLIGSDEEFVIFSNISCPESDPYNRCGVYRKKIPAYEGFYGTTKMFLFEFEAPTETQANSSSFSNYDMPAIWLLNSQIPRQSQYPTNSNCSCWASGCGEFDIFEVTNSTHVNEFYSTFHTFQGTDSLSYGLSAAEYVARKTNSTMTGGVVFDSEGNTVVFMSDSLSFDETISADAVQKAVSALSDDQGDSYLSSVAVSYTSTASSTGSNKSQSSGFAVERNFHSLKYFLITCVLSVLNFVF